MSGKGKNRTVIDMSCTECRERNYSTEKSRRNNPNRLEFKKYCPRCRAHRLYREVR